MPTLHSESSRADTSPYGPATERRRIVASKPAAPPLRPQIIDRPVLLDGLMSATHAPVVLVSAPAGYGTTTLLAVWRERDDRPLGWVSLDATDDDSVALVASVFAALDPIPNLDAAVADVPQIYQSDTVDVTGEARVSVTVANSGNRRGTEVVQLHAADTATGATLPAQQLVGFARIDLEPGASRTVTFDVPLSVLGYTGISGEFVIEPGPVELSAGSSSSGLRSSAKFMVTGQTREITGENRAFLSAATIGS